jgi:hypothetical protein
MAMRGGPRLQVGSAAWIADERSSALGIVQSEIEEFSFAARNEVDWLNEHMAEIFSENQMCVFVPCPGAKILSLHQDTGTSQNCSKLQESYVAGHHGRPRRPMSARFEW